MVPAGAWAEERWVHLGEVQLPAMRETGKIDLNLGSLRRREHHYEIWERTIFAADAAHQREATAGADMSERLTLWAIRCRQGAMAKITERLAGSFEPRTESLRFYVPAPDSSGAAIIDVACSEVRRGATENKSPGVRRKEKSDTGPALDSPPSIFDDEGLDAGDE